MTSRKHVRTVVALACAGWLASPLAAQDGGTRLLRNPSLSATQVAFEYANDILGRQPHRW